MSPYTAVFDVMQPGLMLAHLGPEGLRSEGETLRLLEAGLEAEFYRGYQMLDCPYPEERKAIGAVCRSEGLALTYCLVGTLNRRRLNLSSLDEAARRGAVDGVIALLDDARELGATVTQVISGPAPEDPERRGEALARFGDSMAALCEATGDLALTIEPLDVGAHKRQTLGFTAEALELANRHENLFLCLDTSHMLLNGENITESLGAAGVQTAEFHFCNCATDPESPFYGDLHTLPLGGPGRLSVVDAVDILVFGIDEGIFSAARSCRIFYEVTDRDEDVAAAVRRNKDTLVAIWEQTLEA